MNGVFLCCCWRNVEKCGTIGIHTHIQTNPQLIIESSGLRNCFTGCCSFASVPRHVFFFRRLKLSECSFNWLAKQLCKFLNNPESRVYVIIHNVIKILGQPRRHSATTVTRIPKLSPRAGFEPATYKSLNTIATNWVYPTFGRRRQHFIASHVGIIGVFIWRPATVVPVVRRQYVRWSVTRYHFERCTQKTGFTCPPLPPEIW